MRRTLIRCLLPALIIISILLSGQQESVIASPAPSSDKYAQVKAGEVAPLLSLPNIQGANVPILAPGKPTVIIALHEFRIKRLADFQLFYDKNKQKISLYIVSDSSAEKVQEVFKVNGFTMPVVLDSQRDFLGQYNSTLPSMVIIDQEGIVKYNGTAFVEASSLNNYIERLTAEKRDELPFLLLDPPNYVYQAPPSIDIGDVVTEEHFYDHEDNFVTVKYNDKPTVLLFWAGFNSLQMLEWAMPVIQKAYESRGNRANFYIINFSDNYGHVQQILNRYNVTVPIFFDKYQESNLRYTYSFPAFVIIDQNGVMRYRPHKAITVEQLETIIDSINMPENKVLAERIQHINE